MSEQASAPTFTFGQVQDVLGGLLGIAPEKRGAFASRLQQLQRMGLPKGSNVGRGAKVQYAYWQMAEMLLYLDLLDAGVTPALIQAHFGGRPYYTLAGARLAESAPPDETGYHLLVYLHALEALRSPNAERTKPSATDHSFWQGSGVDVLRRFNEDIRQREGHAPCIIINLSKRLYQLKAEVAHQMPHLEDASIGLI